MPFLISKMSKQGRQELLRDLNYLNIAEIKSFCKQHLKDLTGGEFEDGAIARILARRFWSRGHAPTFNEYASAWLQARKQHKRPNPEWAFLADRADKRAGTDWKKMRARKAKKVMKMLAKIRPIKDG
ncbi:MAG: hypothetical protein JWO71_4193 [Candidatus Acidoferrum typicum]|nr:hypothetical protein [Candidatus Acidoferrum typicum]